MNNNIRVRFAPSPTGYLHVGSLRTALYNYLFARKNKGVFALRIEDTDQSRYVEGSVEKLIKTFDELEISWDEGVYLEESRIPNAAVKKQQSQSYPKTIESGEHGPYVQSERLDLYRKYAQQLVDEGKAYYCFCTPERLESMRKEQIANKQAPKYDRHCLKLTTEEIKQKLAGDMPYVVRFKVPENENVQFHDVVRGNVSFNTNTIDDQVLLKSDGFPTYHLANVVDDHMMQITHVIRGEEWLPSTPKHILLYEALGWPVPQFAHLPLLLNKDKSKLSKRQGDVAVEDYLAKGYLKEALINFVALLGWNPGEGSTQEIFTMEELIDKFELAKVHKAGAVFDMQKLDWINSQHIKKLTPTQLYKNAQPFLPFKELYFAADPQRQTEEYVTRVLVVEQQRLSKFADVFDENPYFFKDIKYEKELLFWKEMTKEAVIESLQKAKSLLESVVEENWNLDFIGKELLQAAGEDRGSFLWPLRASLTGAQKSPSPFEVAWVLGKNETIKRISEAIEKLQ